MPSRSLLKGSKELEYIACEDEQGKYLTNEENGVKIKLRFDNRHAEEAVDGIIKILRTVYDRERNKNERRGENYDETNLLSVPCVDERTGRP